MLDLGNTEPSAWLEVAAAGSALLFGVLASYATFRAQRRRDRALARAEFDTTVDLDEALFGLGGATLSTRGVEISWWGIRENLAAAAPSSDLTHIEERIAAIEERFPDATTIDKIASVNDAIMATKIEALEKTVVDLQSKLLTRWDVAVVLFAVLAALSALVGVYALAVD